MPATQSFWQLLSGSQSIVLPLLQRDYAQGRADAADIRRLFVQALRGAFRPDGEAGPALGLDFVYGTLSGQALTPLDGQQRLTTLFLLHWYLAAGATADARAELRRFTYEGRAAARDFCAALVETLRAGAGRPDSVPSLAARLRDQPWFVPAWHRDPTVRGMLVMLDALDQAFADLPAAPAWRALTAPAPECPITFQFLDLGLHRLTDDLYTRMNARGKPLTAFEHWKARFDELLQANHPGQAANFANKLEDAWTNFFWKNRNQKADATTDPAEQVDGPFLTCLDFITRLRGLLPGPDKPAAQPAREAREAALPFARYQEVYAPTETGAANLAFLTAALDALAAAPPMQELFDGLLEAEHTAGTDRVRLFADWSEQPTDAARNLFKTCVQTAKAGPVEQLLFFTVLTYGSLGGELAAGPPLSDLVRVVRNRVLAFRWADKFSFQLDPQEIEKNLPVLLAEITELTRRTRRQQDVYQALLAWAGAGAGWQAEKHKARLLQPGSPWRARLRRIEDSEHFRGALHLLGNPEWPADAVLEQVLQVIESLWLNAEATNDPEFTGLVVRALAATPGAGFCAANGPYRFWGGGRNGWNLLLTHHGEPARTAAFQAFAGLFGQAAGNWKSRLAQVREQQLPARRAEALGGSDWQKQWPYYLARYAGMTFQDGQFTRCYYKWWNWQYGDRAYQSCAMLSKTTMSGPNFHPFAWAAAQEWKNRLQASLTVPALVALESPEGNGADEHPLLIKRTTVGHAPDTVKLFYGHIEPRGWRLQLPEHRALTAAVKTRFDWQTHTPYGVAAQQWLTGVVGQQTDDIETALAFASALAEPDSLYAVPPDGAP